MYAAPTTLQAAAVAAQGCCRRGRQHCMCAGPGPAASKGAAGSRFCPQRCAAASAACWAQPGVPSCNSRTAPSATGVAW